MKKKLNRREFLKSTSIAIAGLGAVSHSFNFPAFASSLSGKSKVILARGDAVISNRNVCNPQQTAALFDKALLTLTGKGNAKEAWAAIGLAPSDTVAIKVNCNNWTILLAPHKELVGALCSSLMQVIPENNIIFYERTTSDLIDGGFQANKSNRGVRYFGNDEGGGYHPQERLTRIITDTSTKIINLASLKCVDFPFGASVFMKNHIGSLVNEDMQRCHGNHRFLAGVSSRPSIKNKAILALGDGLRATFQRGVPWYWGGIVMGQDSVAAEYAAIQVMNEKRSQEGIAKMETPEYLRLAESEFGLGTCNPEKIDMVKISI